jgi:hypothetical protein
MLERNRRAQLLARPDDNLFADSFRQNGERMAKFKKEDLQAVVAGESDTLETVSDRLIGKGRWTINHELVFRETASGRFFRVHYSEGATEQQDESPFEYATDDVAVVEVRPAERVVTVYEPIPETSTT